ncbi:MAG: GMC family oxidoreductase [Halioglobus sp.]
MKKDEVEYLLIGSGVAASSIATRLLEKDPGASILILEAGQKIPAMDRRLWWDYVVNNSLPYDYTYDRVSDNISTGNTAWQMHQTRMIAYGGTTVHWGAWTPRMKPEDFYLYTNTGEGGDWLVDYDGLETYYCEAEEFLGVGGDSDEKWTHRSKPFPLPPFPYLAADEEFIRAFQENGVVPGRIPVARYGKCMTTGTCRYCPVGARYSAQYTNQSLEDETRYSNFEIRTQCVVTRILTDGKSRVSGAEYLQMQADYNGQRAESKVVHAKNVILCAGAFESPKILMQSTSSAHEHGIGNNNDLVGRYLVSHSFIGVIGTSVKNEERLVSEFNFPTLMSRTFDTEAYQAKGKMLLFRDQILPGPQKSWSAYMQGNTSREEMDAIAVGPRQTGLSAFYEEKGCKSNYLKIASGRTNQFGMPLTEVHFNRTKQVMLDMNDRLAKLGEIFSSMSEYTKIESQIEEAVGYHASGTCRMAATPEEGVVDGDLRVHGMENLYVCSTAVFPSVGAVNPTLTLVALAFRLADQLNGNGYKSAGVTQ